MGRFSSLGLGAATTPAGAAKKDNKKSESRAPTSRFAALGLGGAKDEKAEAIAPSESRLKTILGQIEGSGDEGATKKAKGIAGKVGEALSPVVKALQVLDLPRAAIVSGVREIADISDGGENTHGFIRGIKEHEGVGDALADTNLPINVKRALGFVGDVALDPLTYLAPEAKLAKGAESVARTLLKEGAETLGREAAEDAATRVLRGGVGALSKEELAAIGASGGLKLNVPGTGRLGRAVTGAKGPVQIPVLPFEVTSKLGVPVAAAKTAAKDSKVGGFVGKALGGEDAALRSAMRSGDRNLAPAAFESLEAKRVGRGIIRATEGRLVGEAGELLKPFEKSEGEVLVRALEGDRAAQAALHGRWQPVREWLEKVRVEADLPHLNEYFPRKWSKELRDFLAPEGKVVSSARSGEMVRELKSHGDTFLGETIHGSTQAELRESIEQIARGKFGDDYRQVFSTDPFEVLPLYARDAARRIGRNSVADRLVEAGLFTPKAATEAAPTPTTPKVRQGKLDFAGAKRQAAAERTAAKEAAVQAKRVEVAQESLRSVQEWSVGVRRDVEPWKAQIAAYDKTLSKLEERAGRQANRGLAVDGGLEARIFDLTEQRDILQRRVDVTEGLQQDDLTFAQGLLDAAHAAGRAASPEDQVAALVATADQQSLFATSPLTIDHAPRALRAAKNPELIASAPLEALGAFKGSMSPDEFADALVRVQYVTTPEGWGGFLKGFDKVTQLLKSYQILTPGFHVRNFMGGVFNNSLAGVEYGSYRRYLKARRSFEAGTLQGREAEIMRSIADMGILNGGQTAAEVVGKGRDVIPIVGDNPVLRASFKAGEGVENVLRGTLAYDVLSKGGSVDDALADVAKFHFDYSDLSKFERNVVKRLIPFYTWTRKNFPLQIEQMAKNPGIYAKYLHAKRNLELGTEDENVVPSYFGDLLGIHLPFQVQGSDAYLTPDLPFKDLTKTVNPNQILASVNPLLKAPLELKAGKQFFSDIPFSGKYDVAPATWSRIPGLMQGMSLIGKAKKNAQGQWILSDKDAYLVEQFLPVLGRSRRLAPSEDKYQERVVSSWLGTIFGTGLRTNTVSSQKGELYRRQEKLGDIVADLKARGILES